MGRRLAFLDGLRGYAALQVVALHYLTFFAPAVGQVAPQLPHPAWQNAFIHSPLLFPADGYVAVALFFLISGMVLSGAFEQGGEFWVQAGRRSLRLGLPMAASVLLAAAWFTLWPHAHARAAALQAGNPWLATIGPLRVTCGGVLREMATGGMVLGHVGESLLPGPLARWAGLTPAAQNFNSPLWTLHLEFWGSMLLLALARLRARLSPKAHRNLTWLLLVLLITHPLDLFLIGQGFAKAFSKGFVARLEQKFWTRALAVACILLGILASSHGLPKNIGRSFERFANLTRFPMRLDAFHAYGHFGGILIFFGILLLPGARRALAGKTGIVLGRYSFSLYLVHFPILFTLTSALFVATQSWPCGAVLSVGVGLGVTAVLAVLFEHLVDAPATRLSRRLGMPRVLAQPQPGAQAQWRSTGG